jgi:hypothetical protein
MATMVNSIADLTAPQEDGVTLVDGEFYGARHEEWQDTGAIHIVDGMIDEEKLIATAIKCRVEIGIPYRQITGISWDSTDRMFDLTLSEEVPA